MQGGRKLYGIGCCVGDFDNDGHEDLFVTGFGGCLLYRNNGDGTFTDVTRKAGIAASGFGTSAAFFDYDRDGRLDLFVCQYVRYSLGDDLQCAAAGVSGTTASRAFSHLLVRGCITISGPVGSRM